MFDFESGDKPREDRLLNEHDDLIAALQRVRDGYEQYRTVVRRESFFPQFLSFRDWLKGATHDISRWNEVFE